MDAHHPAAGQLEIVGEWSSPIKFSDLAVGVGILDQDRSVARIVWVEIIRAVQ